jgi:ribonuclease HI
MPDPKRDAIALDATAPLDYCVGQMPTFACANCGRDFEVVQAVLDRYPGWKPRTCLSCKRGGTREEGSRTSRSSRGRPQSGPLEEGLSTREVLEKYHDGPQDGVFTDGASHPNPGPGGWGAVYVQNGAIVSEAFGHEPDTTNNRMELTALLEGCKLVPSGERATIWTDSQLCVNTITKWAAGWEKNGWKRKTGAIKNLDLVKRLYELCRARPELQLRWIQAHAGNRWNEYADALATAYRRESK